MPGALGRVTLVLLFLTCIPSSPDLIEHRYPEPWQPIRAPSADDHLILRLRSTIEAKPDSLATLARRSYALEDGVEFSFSYAAAAGRRFLLLRYFGPIPNPDRYAGYSIQFLYDRHCRRVTKIFLERVPLE